MQTGGEDGASERGATKLLKKPGGLPVARGIPADDGGGHSGSSRLDARNGNSLSRSRAAVASSASSRAAAAATNVRAPSSNSNSLLLRRRRLKRNLSAATAPAASSAVTAASKMNSALSSASLHTRSLDRKTLMKHRQNMQLQPADREWVRSDLHRGCIHVHDRMTPSYPRPVLCTMDTTAGEVALRLSKLCSKSSSVVRIFCSGSPKIDQNGNCNVKYNYSDKVSEDSGIKCNPVEATELRGHPSDSLRLLLVENADERQKQQDVEGKLFTPESESQDNIVCSLSDLNSNMDTPNDDESEHRNGVDSYGLNSGSDVESSAFDDLSSGARLGEHRDSLSDDMVLGTEASILSPSFDSATEGHDLYGSSSDELELDCPASSASMEPISQHHTNGIGMVATSYNQCNMEHLNNMANNMMPDDRLPHGISSLPPSSSGDSLSRACSTANTPDLQDSDGVQRVLTSGLDADQSGDSGDSSPTLYVQLHGEAVRRLSSDERPLQIQNDFLFKLGFKNPWRVQEEGLNTEIGSLLRFYAGKLSGDALECHCIDLMVVLPPHLGKVVVEASDLQFCEVVCQPAGVTVCK